MLSMHDVMTERETDASGSANPSEEKRGVMSCLQSQPSTKLTIMKVSDEPRNWMLTNGANTVSSVPPAEQDTNLFAHMPNTPFGVIGAARRGTWRMQSCGLRSAGAMCLTESLALPSILVWVK